MKNFLAMFVLLMGALLLVPFTAAKAKQGTATVTGKWHFILSTDGGDRIFDPEFKQDGDQVTGKWGADGNVKGTFADGKLNLEFPVTSEEAGPGTLKIKGTLADDALSGDWAFNDYAGSFKATRIKE
jgi:hypothetical protein